jgi:abortive infection bacteriophage resistance protein
LVFNAIEKIEIALRTKIVYEFSLTKGSHWHEDANMYRNNYFFNKNINSLYEEVDRSSETFIEHDKHLFNSCVSSGMDESRSNYNGLVK